MHASHLGTSNATLSYACEADQANEAVKAIDAVEADETDEACEPGEAYEACFPTVLLDQKKWSGSLFFGGVGSGFASGMQCGKGYWAVFEDN